ncbi:MAG: VWA domain-containing protein [Myxococcales bacterium]|nr:MAG: VWA domain-containing protein [Myxococcales bacterium]
MSDAIKGVTKYKAVRTALTSLVRKVGWRSEVGATVFPGLTGDQCAPGSEVFPLRAGDPRSFAEQGQNGPITQGFAKAINLVQTGGTPTGKTLASLVPKLAKLGPSTFVILATDGGPNCNLGQSCGADRCMLNIEQSPLCQDPNCCDPQVDPNYSPVNCLDADNTVAAVEQLAGAGVKTIVVGIPGSDVYGSLLDLMAVAGGAPRPGSPRYYRVENLADLESLLLQIGDQVTVSCDVTLSAPPEHRDLVNVFLDKSLVPSDPDNGWTWTGDDRLTLHGKPCDDLLAGAYEAVRVIVGCPTEVVVD